MIIQAWLRPESGQRHLALDASVMSSRFYVFTDLSSNNRCGEKTGNMNQKYKFLERHSFLCFIRIEIQRGRFYAGMARDMWVVFTLLIFR